LKHVLPALPARQEFLSYELPDDLVALGDVCSQLHEEFKKAEYIFKWKRDLMLGLNPRAKVLTIPEFLDMLKAHKRWEFAYEKYMAVKSYERELEYGMTGYPAKDEIIPGIKIPK
jgi:hypothetical protein